MKLMTVWECFKPSDRGVSYDGEVNYIQDGEPCDNWADNGYMNVDSNFCRNVLPDDYDRPFCFVGGNIRLCKEITQCEEEPTEEEQEHPPKCSVETSVTLCGTVTTLTGSCEQKFDHPDECEFKVVHLNKHKYRLVFSREGFEETLEIGKKQKFESAKCGTFKLDDPNKVEIISPTCGMCMKSSFKSIMPDPEAYTLHPNKKFCRAP